MQFIELSGNTLLNMSHIAHIQPHGDNGCYVTMAGQPAGEDMSADLVLGKEDTERLMKEIRLWIYRGKEGMSE